MKATQSSLYRELENLMLWFIPVGNNIPKDFALRKLGERMQNEILDAMTVCNLALQTQDLHQRMELISLVKLHVTSVQNISRVLDEVVLENRLRLWRIWQGCVKEALSSRDDFESG